MIEFVREGLKFATSAEEPGIPFLISAEESEVDGVPPALLADALHATRQQSYSIRDWNCKHVAEMLWRVTGAVEANLLRFQAAQAEAEARPPEEEGSRPQRTPPLFGDPVPEPPEAPGPLWPQGSLFGEPAAGSPFFLASPPLASPFFPGRPPPPLPPQPQGIATASGYAVRPLPDPETAADEQQLPGPPAPPAARPSSPNPNQAEAASRGDQMMPAEDHSDRREGGTWTPAAAATVLEAGWGALRGLGGRLLLAPRRTEEAARQPQQGLGSTASQEGQLPENVALPPPPPPPAPPPGGGISLGPDRRGCVICLDRPKGVLFMPCRHFAACVQCGETRELLRCPICQAEIDSRMRIFDA